MKKNALLITLISGLTSVGLIPLNSIAQAQNAPAAAATGTAVPGAPSAAKKELLQRLITLQQPGLENLARNLAEQPARQMMGAAEQALPRLPESKREAAIAQIQSDARKYAEDAGSLAKERSIKLSQTVLAPVFDEKFTEEELRQLLSALEAPAYKKYQAAVPDLSNIFADKIIADMRPTLEPKLKALEQNIAKSLGMPLSETEGEASPKPAGKKAKK
jgi:uncharacterized protein